MSNDWHVYRGKAKHSWRNNGSRQPEQTTAPGAATDHPMAGLPEPPPWRRFGGVNRDRLRGQVFQPDQKLVDIVNMAILLRRPLLITGKPGTGKSTLAAAVAEELDLGPLLKWPINTRSTLQEGLYTYDAIGRLQDSQIYGHTRWRGFLAGAFRSVPDPINEIGRYIKLGPLGTAMLPRPFPRVLLIDEIDKSDIDLPNDLLNIFEEGEFEIRELKRQQDHFTQEKVEVETADKPNSHSSASAAYPGWVSIPSNGVIRCDAFPIIILTSNGERDFPPAFLRRCLRYEIPQPNTDLLLKIAAAHFDWPDDMSLDESQLERVLQFVKLRGEANDKAPAEQLLERFVRLRKQANDNLATDQLLNLLYVLNSEIQLTPDIVDRIERALWQDLGAGS